MVAGILVLEQWVCVILNHAPAKEVKPTIKAEVLDSEKWPPKRVLSIFALL